MARLTLSPPFATPLSAPLGGTGVANPSSATLALGGAVSLTFAGGLVVGNGAGTTTLTVSTGKTPSFTNSITIGGVDGKALTIDKNLELDGTDGTKMTFPSTNATIARTDAAQTFTGVQTFSTAIAPGSGGTGVANDATNTITFSGHFGLTLTLTAATSLTLPTSGTVTALGNATTGSGSIVLATAPTVTTLTVSSGGAAITGASTITDTANTANLTLTSTHITSTAPLIITSTAVTGGSLIYAEQTTSAMTGPALWLDLAHGSGTASGNAIQVDQNTTTNFSVTAGGVCAAQQYKFLATPTHVGTTTTCTLGKTGGSGAPANVAMNTWIACLNASGGTVYIPAWT